MKMSLSAFRQDTLAHPDVARDQLDARKIGIAAYQEVKRDRLEHEIPKAQFYDNITKKRLSKTFSDIRKTTSASNSKTSFYNLT